MSQYKYNKYLYKLKNCTDPEKETIYVAKLKIYENGYVLHGGANSTKIVDINGNIIIEPTSALIKAGVTAQKISGMGVVTNLLTKHTCAAYKDETKDTVQKDIKHFADVYKIDYKKIEGCQDSQNDVDCFKLFKSMDHFFHRKRIDLPIAIDNTPKNIVYSTADCYCTMFESEKESKDLWIKGEHYTMAKLMAMNQNIPNTYSTIIFRLAPAHYHRFHMPISGKILSMEKIGKQHYSVQPIIVNSRKPDVYIDNARIILQIQPDDNNKDIIYLAIIGATCVGSIVFSDRDIINKLINKNIKPFKYEGSRNLIADAALPSNKIIFDKEQPHINATDELGWFQYGGSTLVLLYNKDNYHATNIGNKILENSKTRTETEIFVGTELLNMFQQVQ